MKNYYNKIGKIACSIALITSLSGCIGKQVMKDNTKQERLEQKISNTELARQYVDKADALLAKDSTSETALELYNKALQLDQNCKFAYYHRGELYFCLGKPDKAIGDHLKITQIDPIDPETWRHLAQTYQKLYRFEKSIEAWSRCIELLESKDKKIIEHWKSLDYSKDTTREDNLFCFYIMRSQDFRKIGDYNKAQGDIKKALKLRPDHPVAIDEKERAEEGLKVNKK